MRHERSRVNDNMNDKRVFGETGGTKKPAWEAGADGGARTHNLRFRRPLLYPLSYARAATQLYHSGSARSRSFAQPPVLEYNKIVCIISGRYRSVLKEQV